MSDNKTPKHGEICWRELATSDAEKAKKFYHELLGWNMKKSEVSPADYTQIHISGEGRGGIIQMTKDWGDPPPPAHWMTYIAVENCDATAEKIRQHGGGVCVPPFDIPTVGRVAVASDPTGATFSIIQYNAE